MTLRGLPTLHTIVRIVDTEETALDFLIKEEILEVALCALPRAFALSCAWRRARTPAFLNPEEIYRAQASTPFSL